MTTEDKCCEEQKIRKELEQQIRAELDYIFERRSLVELRAIKMSGKHKETASGYFANSDTMAECAMEYALDAYHVYYTLNEVDPRILKQEIGVRNGSLPAQIGAMIEQKNKKPHPLDDRDRTRVTKNRMWYRPKKTTEGGDITKRLALLVDFDPERDEGNTTDAEWQHALDCANACVAHLTSIGWHKPWMGSSGNGVHLVWDIDLEVSNETDSLIRQCLKALAQRFNTAYVHVDTGVFDRSRICKLPGSWAVKGEDSTPERPWRQARTISAPTKRECVSRELLDELAAEVPHVDTSQKRTSADPRLRNIYAAIRKDKPEFDSESWLLDWLDRHDIDYGPKEIVPGKSLWRLKACPYQLHYEGCDHQEDYVAYVAITNDVVIGAGCFKGGCKEFIDNSRIDKSAWKTLRDIVEPGSADRRINSRNRITQMLHIQNEKIDDDILEVTDVEIIDDDESAPHTPRVAMYDYQLGMGFNDTGNGQRLIARHGENMLHVKPKGFGWYIWDGTRWRTDVLGEVFTFAKNTAHYILQEANGLTDSDEDEELRKKIEGWSSQSLNMSRLKAMLEAASTEPGMSQSYTVLDQDPYLFNVANGTLDLRTGTLLPHQREHRITKMSPVIYHPDARCDNWLAFLDTIFLGDQELIAYVQWMLGYALIGHNRSSLFTILHGDGSNGKSTVMETLETTLGDYSARTNNDTFMRGTSDTTQLSNLAALYNARCVVASENDENNILSEGLVKEITGERSIQACKKYGHPFSLPATFKVFLMTQHLPTIVGYDHGIWRRMRVIPFSYTISDEEKNPDFFEMMLKPELSGILNWLLEGVARYQNERENIPQACLDVLAEYREANDPFSQFVAECMTLQPDAWTSSQELLKMAKAWGTTHNIQRLAAGSSQKLRTTVESHPLTKGKVFKKKRGDINGYSGLMLNPEAEKRYCNFSGVNLIRNHGTTN